MCSPWAHIHVIRFKDFDVRMFLFSMAKDCIWCPSRTAKHTDQNLEEDVNVAVDIVQKGVGSKLDFSCVCWWQGIWQRWVNIDVKKCYKWKYTVYVVWLVCSVMKTEWDVTHFSDCVKNVHPCSDGVNSTKDTRLAKVFTNPHFGDVDEPSIILHWHGQIMVCVVSKLLGRQIQQ